MKANLCVAKECVGGTAGRFVKIYSDHEFNVLSIRPSIDRIAYLTRGRWDCGPAGVGPRQEKH